MRIFNPGKIRERRQRLGITQSKLAQTVDISRTHMYDVEQGKAMPTAGIIAKVAFALRVRESFFFVDAVSYEKHLEEKEGVYAR